MKCFRPIKGHPIPRGNLCKLEPCMSSTELEEIQKSLHNETLEKKRIGMATPKNKQAYKKRKAIKQQNETKLERTNA